MLKWVVTHSGNSLNNQANTVVSVDTNKGQHLKEDSVLDNSDSLIEWQDNSSTDTSVNSSKCDISFSPGKDELHSSTPIICHGLNADSGIYSCSLNNEDLSGVNDNCRVINNNNETASLTDSRSCTSCTANDGALSETDTAGSNTSSFNLRNVKGSPNRNTYGRVTKSLDFDSESCFTDDEPSVVNGYHSETESLDLDDVFVVSKKQNYNQRGPRKGRRSKPRRKNGLQRKLSDDSSEQENIHLKRSRLVEQIDRENKLKLGAENLFKATDNRRLKQTVEVELKFIQSHIQLLTDELADMDTAMESKDLLQSGVHRGFPMIQVGLKETKDIDFHYAFKNFIEDHYFENGDCFNKEIEEFEILRQLIRCPLPNDEGIALLYEYYNHLYFVDKRFFPPGRGIGIYFPWFDAVTRTLSTQRAMGFEKGCVLFNIAALHSQIAAQKRRVSEEDCEQAASYLQKAAGVLKHLDENFSYAPSTDMQTHTLKILVNLMLAQAQECMFEALIHRHNANSNSSTIHDNIQLAQEAAVLYDKYKYCGQLMYFDCIKEYIPHKWHILVQVKTLHFKAVSNYHAAECIIQLNTIVNSSVDALPVKDSLYEEVCDLFELLSMGSRPTSVYSSRQEMLDELSMDQFIKGSADERKHLAKACLSRAVLSHEEALRVHAQHQRVKRIPYYHDVHQLLKLSHDRCLQKYSDLDEEDDFTELSSVPNIKAKSCQPVRCIQPDVSSYRIKDPFKRLGPLFVFCAKHYWDEPKRIELHKKNDQEFGFSVRGDQPVIVAEVDTNSIAEKAGIRPGDFIVRISNQDVKWSKHQSVVQLIRGAGQHLVLCLITPLDKNYLSGSSINNSEQQTEHNITNNNESGSNGKYVMQCGTLERNKQIRLSGRSTKSLTFTLRKLKPSSHQNSLIKKTRDNILLVDNRNKP